MIAVILNIEQDHLDYYGDIEEINSAFRAFALGSDPDGVIVVNGEDENIRQIVEDIQTHRQVETFGFAETNDYSAQNIELVDGTYVFDVLYKGKWLGSPRLSLPGRHNILNALAVTAAAINAGVYADKVMEFLGQFTGVERRLTLKADIDGKRIIDDYAHHPTEIRASLQAIREKYQPGRLFCVFQPHQYSRTRFLLDDFAESFKLADVTIVPEIYFVRDTEQSRQEVNSQMLVEKIYAKGSEAIFIEGFSQICDYLKENVQNGDVVVTMGAGDVWKVADEYIQWLG